MDLLELVLDDVAIGIEAARVIEVAGRVLHTPAPSAPAHIAGFVTYRGSVIAVVTLRERLRLPSKTASCDDQLVVVRTARGRTVALLVDRVVGLRSGIVLPPPVPAEHIAGVVVLEDGLLLIDDVDTVLSIDDERFIDEATSRAAS